jgi:TRAP-type C4-dicarboxylate transport system permease small subunit
MARTNVASLAAGGQGGLVRLLADNAEELLALVLVVVIGIVMAAQVLLRTLFDTPLSWPEELSQFLFVWCSALGAIGAYKRHGLVRLDLLTRGLSGRAQAALEYLCVLLTAVFLAVLGWKGYQLASRTSFSAATLPITWAWAYAAAPVFSALMIGRMLQLQVFKREYRHLETLLAPDVEQPAPAEARP